MLFLDNENRGGKRPLPEDSHLGVPDSPEYNGSLDRPGARFTGLHS